MTTPQGAGDPLSQRGIASSRRARAHGAAALGLGAPDPVTDAETYELSTAANDVEDAPFAAVPIFASAGFDALTAGEYAWMFASLAVVIALTGVGLAVCFAT